METRCSYGSCSSSYDGETTALAQAEEMIVPQPHAVPPTRSSMIIRVGVGVAALFALVLCWLSSGRWPAHAAETLERLDIKGKRPKPNIVFILADDLAWNSMGYRDFDLRFATPMMDKLAKDGIIFDNYYAEHLCTPARAALLTGRYPIHTGMQYGVLDPESEWGLPLDEMLFPQYLQAAGYNTHMAGKWHLGHYSPGYLPTARGFDTFLGFLCGEEDYYSHKYTQIIENTMYSDFLWSNKTHYRGAEYYEGMYSLEVYMNDLVGFFNEQSRDKPFLVYAAPQNVHSPLCDLPDEWFTDIQLSEISALSGTARKEYAKSLIMLDSFVGSIVATLEGKGLLDNTYIIFSSDNGGCAYSGGRNGPLRGGKAYLYEGGLKVDAWVWSPMLPASVRGLRFQDLTHITEWFPTILSLAGIDLFGDSLISKPKHLDGYDLSDLILGHDYTHLRNEIVHNIDIHVDGPDFDLWTNGSVALRMNDLKLVHEKYAGWYDIRDDDTDDDKWSSSVDCGSTSMDFDQYLFNVLEDPYETTNLIHTDVSVTGSMYERLRFYAESTVESVHVSWDGDTQVKATAQWDEYGNTIVPWDFTYCGDFLIPECQ